MKTKNLEQLGFKKEVFNCEVYRAKHGRDLQNIKYLVTPLIQKYEEKDIHSR